MTKSCFHCKKELGFWADTFGSHKLSKDGYVIPEGFGDDDVICSNCIQSQKKLEKPIVVEKPPAFRSIKTISKLTSIFLILSISVTIIGDISGVMEIKLLSLLDQGIDILDDEIEANDLRVGIIGYIETIIVLTIYIIFFIWFYKAYRNLSSLGARELEFSSKWVVAYFFIPILWFYKPYRAMKEIWKSSDTAIGESDKASRKQMRTPIIIKFWWAFWIIGNFIGMFYLRTFSYAMNLDTISGFITYNYIDIITDIPLIILDVLALVLVRKISFNQEKKTKLSFSDTENS